MSEGMVEFDLSRLHEIDGGRIKVLFDRELRRCIEDIDDRPVDKRARTIAIKFTIKPNANPSDGLLEGGEMEVDVESKLPTYRSKKYSFGVRNGRFRYQPMSPTDHNARPLPGFDDHDQLIED